MSENKGAFPGIVYPSVAPQSSNSITSVSSPYAGIERHPIADFDQAAVVAVAAAEVVTAAVAVRSGVAPAGQSAVGATAPAESQALG